MSALMLIQHRNVPDMTDVAAWSPPEVIDFLIFYGLEGIVPIFRQGKVVRIATDFLFFVFKTTYSFV